MENVRVLHRPQQSMPKGQLPTAIDQRNRRLHCRTTDVKLHVCLLEVQPNPNKPSKPGENLICDKVRAILLPSHALRPKNAGGKGMTWMFKKQIGRSMEVYVDKL